MSVSEVEDKLLGLGELWWVHQLLHPKMQATESWAGPGNEASNLKDPCTYTPRYNLKDPRDIITPQDAT